MTTPPRAERRDERERERHAGEVGKHAGGARDDAAQHTPWLAGDHRRGQPGPEDGAEGRPSSADRIRLFLSGIQYCDPVKMVLKFVPGELAGVGGERAMDHLVERQPEEDQDVDA